VIDQTVTLPAKDVLPNMHRPQAAEIAPPAWTEWSRLLVRDVIFSESIPFRCCREVTGVHSAFFVSGGLDL